MIDGGSRMPSSAGGDDARREAPVIAARAHFRMPALPIAGSRWPGAGHRGEKAAGEHGRCRARRGCGASMPVQRQVEVAARRRPPDRRPFRNEQRNGQQRDAARFPSFCVTVSRADAGMKKWREGQATAPGKRRSTRLTSSPPTWQRRRGCRWSVTLSSAPGAGRQSASRYGPVAAGRSASKPTAIIEQGIHKGPSRTEERRLPVHHGLVQQRPGLPAEEQANATLAASTTARRSATWLARRKDSPPAPRCRCGRVAPGT